MIESTHNDFGVFSVVLYIPQAYCISKFCFLQTKSQSLITLLTNSRNLSFLKYHLIWFPCNTFFHVMSWRLFVDSPFFYIALMIYSFSFHFQILCICVLTVLLHFSINSFLMEVLISKSMDWFLYDLRHEKINCLIHMNLHALHYPWDWRFPYYLVSMKGQLIFAVRR